VKGERAVTIREFSEGDASGVRELFIVTNRLLAPPQLWEAFEAYIELALVEEIDRLADYYREHDGGFWVAVKGERLVGTFGLERAAADAMELRRMYVDAGCRRTGIGRRMLEHAEGECRRRGIARLVLSTAALQEAAVAFYRSAGYQLVRVDTVEIASNKMVGSGLQRLYFEKVL
jgi:putative acetyltransferase